MIEGNVIKFGYGDIIIESFEPLIVFKAINTCVPIDVALSEKDFEGLTAIKSLTIKPTVDEVRNVINVLENSSVTICLHLKISNVVLDFTNYNEKSIKVVIKHLKRFIAKHLMLTAA